MSQKGKFLEKYWFNSIGMLTLFELVMNQYLE